MHDDIFAWNLKSINIFLACYGNCFPRIPVLEEVSGLEIKSKCDTYLRVRVKVQDITEGHAMPCQRDIFETYTFENHQRL